MAEVEQVKLSVVLGVIDGVHVLGAKLPMSLFAAVLGRSFCAQCDMALKALTVAQTQSHSSYPLHFLLAADAIIVAQSGIGLWEASWERQAGGKTKGAQEGEKKGMWDDLNSCFLQL